MQNIIVPFRDRQEHLNEFVPAIRAYVPNSPLYIIEQTPGKPFNRAKLLNIGAIEFPADSFVFHDVDMIPDNVDYSESHDITQLASSDIQIKHFLGGVTMFPNKIFRKLNGYSNDFFCRGEDNEMWYHVVRSRIKIVERFGKFRYLSHARPEVEIDRQALRKARLWRTHTDGLINCTYQILSKEVTEHYTKITVEI